MIEPTLTKTAIWEALGPRMVPFASEVSRSKATMTSDGEALAEVNYSLEIVYARIT